MFSFGFSIVRFSSGDYMAMHLMYVHLNKSMRGLCVFTHENV